MNNIYKIDSYTPRDDENFLLDTNVLIKIFYPTLASKNSTPYIEFFNKIQKQKASLLISSIQLSEFINRCIRFQFDLYKKSHSNIKSFKEDYRNTNDYKECMSGIIEIVKTDILPAFLRINDNFENMNPDNFLVYGFSYDFNDAIIAEIARLKKAILVTDDRDYANHLDGLNIATNNRALLMFQSKH